MKKCRPMKAVALLLVWACVFTLLAGCSTPAAPTVPTGTNPTVPTGTNPTVPTGTNPTEPSETDPTVNANRIEFIANPFAFPAWEGATGSLMRDIHVIILDDKVFITSYGKQNIGTTTQYTVSQRLDHCVVEQVRSVDNAYCYYDKEETRAILERLTCTEKFTYLETGYPPYDIHKAMLMYYVDGTYYLMETGIAGTNFFIIKIWVGKPTE